MPDTNGSKELMDEQPQRRWARLRERLFAPVDVASIVVFRVLFGAIMLWEVWRYVDMDRIRRYYIEPDFHFTYEGFGWVRAWPGTGMYWHFAALALLSVFIMVGFLYRISAVLFFLAFSYVFLLDQARYLNHFYFVCLLSFLLIFVPANRARSVDARLRPGIRSDTVAAWSLWLLRAQVGILYFYGGVAKINGDWLRGRPLNEWLADRGDDAMLGFILRQPWAPYFFSYSGMLLDLLVVPFLLWRRTRLIAFGCVVLFHLLNARIFSIGIFPWLGIAATTLFLAPDWPRRLISGPLGAAEPGPGMAKVSRPLQSAIMALIGVYLAVQMLVPLRHWLYPGVVHWTEEGHRFSWHMKLRDKSARAKFFALDPVSGRGWEIDQSAYLSAKQRGKMAGRPYMLLQFAHHVADDLRSQGFEQIQIRAHVRASLNGRDRQLLIDPTVDLSQQTASLMPADWILPLIEKLPARE